VITPQLSSGPLARRRLKFYEGKIMPLNEKQRTRFQSWIDKHDINPKCPACGKNDMWAPGEVIASPMLDQDSFRVEGKSIPMVQLVCNNCASVLLFAANPIGLAK
jgi:hypothetical protein